MTPKGNNDSSSKTIFKERTLYDELYSTGEENNINPIDLWGDHKLLYGRVDYCGNPIFLNENKLVELPNEDDVYLTTDIVADAYKKVKDTIGKSQLLNRINPGSKILPLKVKRSFISVHQDYHRTLEAINRIFNSGYVSHEVDRKIVNYATFEREFINFYPLVSNRISFTRTSFITSQRSSPLLSGLMLEFDDGGHDEDKLKYEKYIKDPEFKFYSDTLKRYGFVLDKNAPWRAILDLESPPVMEMLKARGYNTVKEYFKNYYYSSHRVDLQTIKNYMHKLYDSYVALNPTVTRPRLSQCTGPSIVSEVVQRRRMSLNDFKKKYNDEHWYKFYVKIRNMETNKNFNDKQLDLITKNALRTRKYKGNKMALDYVQSVFRGFDGQVFATNVLTDKEVTDTIQTVRSTQTSTTGY